MADVQLWDRIPYYTTKASSILDISDAYTNIATLSIPASFEAGDYEFAFSLTFSMNSTSNSTHFRWRLDGGTWSEFIIQVKSSSNVEPLTYFYPKAYTSGAHTFDFEMKKSSASNTLDLHFLDLILKKVGA